MTREDLIPLDNAALKARFLEATGAPPVALNRNQMIRRILDVAEAAAAGARMAPPPEPEPRAEAAPAAPAPRRQRKAAGAAPAPSGLDGRLPPVGTALRHTLRDETVVEATIVEVDGRRLVECRGTLYKSLSAAAKAVAGTIWNGNLFFGLKPYPGRGAKKAPTAPEAT